MLEKLRKSYRRENIFTVLYQKKSMCKWIGAVQIHVVKGQLYFSLSLNMQLKDIGLLSQVNKIH